MKKSQSFGCFSIYRIAPFSAIRKTHIIQINMTDSKQKNKILSNFPVFQLQFICSSFDAIIINFGSETMEVLNLQAKNTEITHHYKFIKEIGRGASGICYLAENRQKCQQLRCIKEIKKTAKNGSYPKEAVLLSQLTHPNIIQLNDVYENQKAFYLVTQYCEGGDLFDYVQKQGALSENQAKDIITQILSALNYCHLMKICHRDIKLQNFLVSNSDSPSPIIKLIDFDLAFQWNRQMEKQVLERQGRKIKGTPYYIPPEMLEGIYNEKCDIWAVGVLLFIMLTGRPPFDGENQTEIFQNIRTRNINFHESHLKHLSLLSKDLLKKILTAADRRIQIDQIFRHPWMIVPQKKIKMKVDFSYIARYHQFSKLKQIAACYLATQMTLKETSCLSMLFGTLDKNKDGYISRKELEDGLIEMDFDENMKDEFLRLLRMSMNQYGLINYNQFIAIFITKKSIQSEKNLRKVFNSIDNDGNGLIDMREMKAILNKLNYEKMPIKQQQINQDNQIIFRDADINKDGLIDFEQFKLSIINDYKF